MDLSIEFSGEKFDVLVEQNADGKKPFHDWFKWLKANCPDDWRRLRLLIKRMADVGYAGNTNTCHPLTNKYPIHRWRGPAWRLCWFYSKHQRGSIILAHWFEKKKEGPTPRKEKAIAEAFYERYLEHFKVGGR